MGHTNNDETKKIPLGSGDLYCIEYSGTIPADATFETDTNRLGHVTGGASSTSPATIQRRMTSTEFTRLSLLTKKQASRQVLLHGIQQYSTSLSKQAQLKKRAA